MTVNPHTGNNKSCSLRKTLVKVPCGENIFKTKNLTYPQGRNFWEYEVLKVKGKTMRILIMTAITAVALPFMAVGQTTEEAQQTQGQTKETQTTAPAKGKKMRPAQDQTNPE